MPPARLKPPKLPAGREDCHYSHFTRLRADAQSPTLAYTSTRAVLTYMAESIPNLRACERIVFPSQSGQNFIMAENVNALGSTQLEKTSGTVEDGDRVIEAVEGGVRALELEGQDWLVVKAVADEGSVDLEELGDGLWNFRLAMRVSVVGEDGIVWRWRLLLVVTAR
ncbi:hypothetical protein Acr_05g0002440 [Actinidia rufa]|uniref:Uncharacterized protein n=1 Tax=Actinidia rufa TaxID=165716 RepID=A0A7J0EJG5_9ERIC|nr:hypothetical protein Acr_05g0002440 [Actinidia rufa]